LRGNRLVKYVIEGKIGGKGRRGRMYKQLLDDLEEKRSYWKLEEEVLDRNVWRSGFGTGYETVVRQTKQ
jgi:hypothetical protein